MRRLAAVIFDMDGTLVDSLDVVPEAYVRTVFELSGRTCTKEEVIASFPAGPARGMLTVLLDRPSTDRDLSVYHRNLAAVAPEVHCYPGIPELVARVSRSLPVGVFTGAGRDAATLILGRTGSSTGSPPWCPATTSRGPSRRPTA